MNCKTTPATGAIRFSGTHYLLLTALFLFLYTGAAVAAPPEPGPMPQRGFATGKIVFVDAATGRDFPQCGRENTPCLTISQGVTRARQIQDDPVAADDPDVDDVILVSGLENLVTVQVGPGTYNEAVLISADWIRLLGAGAGSSIITRATAPDGESAWNKVPLLVRGAHPVWVGGFTFTGGTRGMALRSGAQVFITDSVFDDNTFGLTVGFSSHGYVERSTFSNNNRGAAVVVGSYLSLEDISITGRGGGVGVWAAYSSSAEIYPVDGTLSNQITNTSIGVWAQSSSRIEISEMGITGNRFAGAYVTDDSFLRAYGGVITNNDFGVFLEDFSNGVLDGTDISGNNIDATSPDSTSAVVVRP